MRFKQSSTYTTPLGLTSLFTLCGLPLRLDSYKGCAFNCRYCFARAREQAVGSPLVKPADPKYLGRLLDDVFYRDGADRSLVRRFLMRRVPIHFGGMSDPFQPAEERYRITLEYLKALKRHGYPVAISTRGVLAATEPYLTLLSSMQNVLIQFSLSTTIDRLSAVFEEQAVRPSRLLRAMERLSARGVAVSCRWQPYIPGLSDSPEVFVGRVAAAGCRHISFEFLKLAVEQKGRILEAYRHYSNEDLYRTYLNAGAKYFGRDLVLPADKRLQTILRVRASAHLSRMTFGAADNDFQHFSDTECCCSGVDQFRGFNNWYRYQIGHAVRKSRRQEITLASIASEWVPQGSINRFLNSNSRLVDSEDAGSIRSHIKRRWNSSGKEGSPAYFFGTVATDRFTSDGARVYEWSSEVMPYLPA